MFLDKKTLLRGTAPASLQKRRSSYYKIRKLLQNTVTLVTKCVVTRECVFLFLYHGVFSFFATLIGNYSGSLSDAKVVKDIRPVFIKTITTGNFRKIIDSKKHSQALIPRYSSNKVSARSTTALTKKSTAAAATIFLFQTIVEFSSASWVTKFGLLRIQENFEIT